MKKVLYITEILFHYRVPLFELLSKEIDLTIAHGGEQILNPWFKQVQINIKQVGPFVQIEKIPLVANYDVVILSFNLRIISFYKILFSPRKYKLLLYGIGVSASYKNSYDSKKSLDWLRRLWIKMSDGAIFYEFYPVVKYASSGINHYKLHAAYNTVAPSDSFNYQQKTFTSYIFLGSLYKEKRIYELLEAYKDAHIQQGGSLPNLEIIGSGEEYLNIHKWILRQKLESKIILHGAINDNSRLGPIMARAIACISPGQAGLSVQNCFSFGVPFVTTKNAITGGELFSIIDHVNGFIYDGTSNKLKELLIELSANKALIEMVSKNAYSFYHNFRTPAIWASAFKKAIEI